MHRLWRSRLPASVRRPQIDLVLDRPEVLIAAPPDLCYDFTAEELGIDPKTAAKAI
jgi:hypothetical protein